MDNATLLLQSIVQDFHFQRPLWLFMLIPAALIVAGLSFEHKRRGRWQQLIAPHLIPYLVDAPDARRSIWQTVLLFIGWTLACLAIAGPSWERIPTPVHKSQHALTIVLDLSPSMLAEDVKPSRLVRARYKLEDLLKERKEGLTALISYAGEAYVITPFTDDSDTIINMLPSMHPNNLPLPGSNVEMGIEQALALFQQSQIAKGDILLISDGIAAEAIDTVRNKLEDTPHQLSILAVGTADGAPIPNGQGAFLRDAQRQVIIAKMNPQQLRRLALSTDGRYSGLTTDNRDLQYLLNDTQLSTGNETTVESEREFDNWVDRGLWLCWLLIPVMLLAFRKGQVAAVLLVTGLTLQSPTIEAQELNNAATNTTSGTNTKTAKNNGSDNSLSSSNTNERSDNNWKDLWRSPDQKALKAFEQQHYQRAADTFETKEWKAAAEYKAGNYEQAAELYSNIDTADGHYNRGNALARSGQLDSATEAYQKALNLDPEHTQAADNKAVVEQLLEQQKQQSQSGEDGKEGGDNQQSGQDQSQSKDQDQEQNQDSQSSQSEDSQGSDQGRDANSQSNSSETTQKQNDQQSTSNNSSGAETSENNTEKSESDETSAQQQTEEEQSKQEQSRAAQAQQGEPEEGTEQDAEQAQMAGEATNKSELIDEEQQTLNLWLRQIEDDPSGLLRRKLHHQQQIIREQYRSGEWTPPENGAMERY